MNNFALGWRNHVLHEDTATFDLTSGTVSAGALANLQDMRLSKRVTISETIAGDGVVVIEFTWDVASGTVPIGLLGLLNYSASAPGADYVTVSLSATAPGDGEYASTASWEAPSADFPLHFWALLENEIQADKITVLIFAEYALGSGGGTLTVTAGGLWGGPVWTLPDGIESTWSQAIVDRGTVGRSEGGQGYPRRRQRYRSFEGRAIHVPFEYAFGDEDDATVLDIQQLLYRIGTTEPVALFPRTQDAAGVMSTHVMHRLGIYGHMAETGRIEHLGGDLYQWTGVRVDELM